MRRKGIKLGRRIAPGGLLHLRGHEGKTQHRAAALAHHCAKLLVDRIALRAAENGVDRNCFGMPAVHVAHHLGPHAPGPWPAPQFVLKRLQARVVDIDNHDPRIGLLGLGSKSRPRVQSAVFKPHARARVRQQQQRARGHGH